MNKSELDKSEAHDHEYKAVKYTVQEAVIKHWNYKDHHLTTLVHDRVKLFCVKCGDVIEAESEQS